MTDDPFAQLAAQHTLGDQPIPEVVQGLAGDDAPELVWRNDLDGMTFRTGERYCTWDPRTTGSDLEPERRRLLWLAGRHPAPRVVGYGEDEDARWLLTEAVPGELAVGDRWRARRTEQHPSGPDVHHVLLVTGGTLVVAPVRVARRSTGAFHEG